MDNIPSERVDQLLQMEIRIRELSELSTLLLTRVSELQDKIQLILEEKC